MARVYPLLENRGRPSRNYAFAGGAGCVLAGMKLAIWIALAGFPALAQTPDIDDIMARVAANQAKSVEARQRYVYRQDELVSLHKGNGKVACEERREYAVTPGPAGIVKQVTKSEVKGDGTCAATFSDSDESHSGTRYSIGDEVETKHTGDGVPHDLFPLTARQQLLYTYRMEGVEKYRGRRVYRIAFQPNHHRDNDGDEGFWKGETLIDAEEFQPVLVTTDLTAKIPMAVRLLLGTNVRGVGFTVNYQRMPDGIWFPGSFGGEFEVRALFFIKRTVAIDVTNSDFRHTDVASSLTFDTGKQ